jgi:hypothetical protein
MRSTPADLLSVAVTVTFIMTLAVVALCLIRRRPSRSSLVRFLTGTRAQQAALV